MGLPFPNVFKGLSTGWIQEINLMDIENVPFGVLG